MDTDNELCARCKFGALRIITGNNKIVCGSQTLSLEKNMAGDLVVKADAKTCEVSNWYYD